MKEYLRQLKDKDFDGLNFYLNDDDNLEITGFSYKNPGEKIGGTSAGDYYHIILLERDSMKMPEIFKAILISPLHYISRIIDDGFLGVVAKVTTTSETVMQNCFEDMCRKAAEYIKEMEDDE